MAWIFFIKRKITSTVPQSTVADFLRPRVLSRDCTARRTNICVTWKALLAGEHALPCFLVGFPRARASAFSYRAALACCHQSVPVQVSNTRRIQRLSHPIHLSALSSNYSQHRASSSFYIPSVPHTLHTARTEEWIERGTGDDVQAPRPPTLILVWHCRLLVD